MKGKASYSRPHKSQGGGARGAIVSFLAGFLITSPVWAPGNGSSASASVFCEAQQSVEGLRTNSVGIGSFTAE